MEAVDIINGLEDFFKNLSQEEFEEIKEAFSVEIEGDVSIDEYLSNFSDQYFYTSESDSRYYRTSKVINMDAGGNIYVSGKFDGAEAKYSVEISEHSNYSVHEMKDVKKAA